MDATIHSLRADVVTLDYNPVECERIAPEIAIMSDAHRDDASVVLEVAGKPIAYRVKGREVSGPAPLGRTPWYRFVLVRER